MIKIEISGIGGGVNYEVEMVKRALQLAGFDVEVVDNEWDTEQLVKVWFDNKITVDQWVDMARQRHKDNNIPMDKVEITVKHIPWGG